MGFNINKYLIIKSNLIINLNPIIPIQVHISFTSTLPKLSDGHKHSADADHENLEALLALARPFLRDDLRAVDEDLPGFVSVLHDAGAGECWHKQGSFFDHLFGVYRILKMWKVPDAVCRLGLFHSAYSNSYVNLAIFPPNSVGRDTVRGYVGAAAERLIHIFCVVSRQPLIFDLMLFKYSDEELADHLRSSEVDLQKVREGGGVGEDEIWRAKLRSICPAEGITMKHIRTGEDVQISRRLVAIFLLMTIADLGDKMYNYQDVLFDNLDGRLYFAGSNTVTSLWPGDGKPGLWTNCASKIGAIYTLIAREEEIYLKTAGEAAADRDGDLELVIPPIFEGCSRILDREEQIAARDLYWEAVCGVGEMGVERAEEKLVESIAKNPYVGEGYVVLGQILLGKGEFAAAEAAVARGLRLILEWGSTWDKRMTWQGWVAWCRVLLAQANQKSWPKTSWGINNLGLVRDKYYEQ